MKYKIFQCSLVCPYVINIRMNISFSITRIKNCETIVIKEQGELINGRKRFWNKCDLSDRACR